MNHLSARMRVAWIVALPVIASALGMGGCAVPTPTGTDDGNDWILNPTTEHYYKLTEAAGTNSATQAEATAEDATLVVVDDATENQWLVDTFGTATGADTGFWIGYAYDDADGWMWQQSTDQPTYTNWATDEPAVDEGQGAAFYADGTWQAAPVTESRLAIMERETAPQTDNENDNTATGEYPAGARAYRIEHTGTGTYDLPTYTGELTVDAHGTIVAIPGEATTSNVTYRVTYDYTPKEYDGATTVMEPNSFAFTATVEWELYWDTIVGPECFQFVGAVIDEPTQTATLTTYGEGIALLTHDEDLSAFSNAYAPSIHRPYGEITICDGELVWPHTLNDGGVVIDMTVELIEIGFEELDE